jgi:hypothetical protein
MFAIEEIESKEFKREFEDENITIYIFYDSSKESRRDDCDIQKIAIYSTTIKSLLSLKYKNYKNIFSFTEYMEIAENPQITYTINLTEDATALYKLIYHLSEKELRVLREYLEKSQQCLGNWLKL